MPYHIYKGWKTGDEPRWFGVLVNFEEDRWVSTCTEVDQDGAELAQAATVVPKFYGVTAEQARRRMIDALENTFDEVTPAGEETAR